MNSKTRYKSIRTENRGCKQMPTMNGIEIVHSKNIREDREAYDSVDTLTFGRLSGATVALPDSAMM